MQKTLKWIGVGLMAIIGILAITIIVLSSSANARLHKQYNIQPQTVAIPTDPASLEDGQHLVSIYCQGCHGEDLGGAEFFNQPSLAMVDTANLTSGAGGVGSQYQDVDWVRAIRHGVDPQGRPLFIMPSGDFYHFSDEDLGKIIAYIKSVPPVDRATRDFSTALVGRTLMAVGAFGDVLSAEGIDHTGPRPVAPEPAISAAYGEYLVNTFGCRTCHGPALSGGQDPAPGAPLAPNLTRAGNLQNWSGQDFISNIRARRSEWMPFESLSKMTNEQLQAIFMYLQSLPELETTTK